MHRTIYDADEMLVGMMDTGELASQVIEAVNSFDPYRGPICQECLKPLNTSNTTEKDDSTS